MNRSFAFAAGDLGEIELRSQRAQTDIRQRLPVHAVGKLASPYVLLVDGFVERPLQLTREVIKPASQPRPC
jgi:hypothetical protein